VIERDKEEKSENYYYVFVGTERVLLLD